MQLKSVRHYFSAQLRIKYLMLGHIGGERIMSEKTEIDVLAEKFKDIEKQLRKCSQIT